MSYTSFIKNALTEDIGPGDYSTLASIDLHAAGKAVLKVKDKGILAGIKVAEEIFRYLQPDVRINVFLADGSKIQPGDIAFEMEAKTHTILSGERLALNCLQRMSGIATLTHMFVEKIKHTNAKILDTRKTTPLFRQLEKDAVVIGGGYNHRFGLYDMVMLKDNHIDFCGGIEKAVRKTKRYLEEYQLDLKIEVETRTIEDIREVLQVGDVDRIMLDNFTPELMKEGISLISGRIETEASGGINLDNIVSYAETGVDYISIGALTHQAQSLDLSLKAVKEE
ncbi:MAG: carboxylating nicotinate-nucleotide diphosphorylase [Taibaiella sp.]|nr:carboxylating nicotinate-nucleotide diphosphorylase [Taibaiella sp.]